MVSLSSRLAAVSLDLDGDRAWFADHGRRQHRCRSGFPHEGGSAVLVFVRRDGSGFESFVMCKFEGDPPAAIDFAGEEYLCRAAFAAFVGAGGTLITQPSKKTPAEAGVSCCKQSAREAGSTLKDKAREPY